MKCVFARLRDSSGILRKQAAHRGLVITLNTASYKFYCGSDKQQECSSRAFCRKSGVSDLRSSLVRLFECQLTFSLLGMNAKRWRIQDVLANSFIKLAHCLMLQLNRSWPTDAGWTDRPSVLNSPLVRVRIFCNIREHPNLPL